MAIYEVPSRKKLKNKNHDIQNLMKTMGAERHGSELVALLKRSKERGEDVFVWLSPFTVEIGPAPTIYGGTDFESECDAYYSSADDI